MNVDFRAKRVVNGVVTTSAPVTQRWPVTRSRATRAAVDYLWYTIHEPSRQYIWVRVTPQGTSRFVRWAA